LKLQRLESLLRYREDEEVSERNLWLKVTIHGFPLNFYNIICILILIELESLEV
jgi:hypothetical protein